MGKRDVQKQHQAADGSAATAPVQPVTAQSYAAHAAELEQDVVVSKQDRLNLEEKLATTELGTEGSKIVPVWVVGDKDGDLENGDVVLKDQNRWTSYAQRGMLQETISLGDIVFEVTNEVPYSRNLAYIPLHSARAYRRTSGTYLVVGLYQVQPGIRRPNPRSLQAWRCHLDSRLPAPPRPEHDPTKG